MKTRSLNWAALPGLALLVDAKTFSTESKCCIVNGKALCPGETWQLDTSFVTIMAGFPPNSKTIAKWKPKWEETVYLTDANPINGAKYTDFFLGSDECVYTRYLINDHVTIKCLNEQYTRGAVPNPWYTLNFGPEGPVDYKDPQHYVTDGGFIQDQWNMRMSHGPVYDPEGLLPPNSDIYPSDPKNPDRPAPPEFDHQAAPLSYPPLKFPYGGRAWPGAPRPKDEDKSSTETPEKDASAGSTGIFSAADLPTSFNGVFDGDDGANVAANLDISQFGNVGDVFTTASKADPGAFGSTDATIADGGSDWTSALTPSSDENLFAGGPNDANLFAGDPSDAFLTGDGSSLELSAGTPDDNLFVRRSPRDFRW